MLVDKNHPRSEDEDAKPASKFKDGEYEVADLIEHNGKRYAPGQKVHLTAAEAETLAGVRAIKV